MGGFRPAASRQNIGIDYRHSAGAVATGLAISVLSQTAVCRHDFLHAHGGGVGAAAADDHEAPVRRRQ